jgi:cysteine synthase
MRRSGGRPLVVSEAAIAEAHELAQGTGIPVSVTGSAGLAGLLADAGRPAPGERVVVIFSGVAR